MGEEWNEDGQGLREVTETQEFTQFRATKPLGCHVGRPCFPGEEPSVGSRSPRQEWHSTELPDILDTGDFSQYIVLVQKVESLTHLGV